MKNEMIIDKDGTKRWFLNNKRHREDGPAIEFADGSKEWYLHNELHREDGPAAVRPNGAESWYLNGKLHRVDGPAKKGGNGNTTWHRNGELHRVDGPASEWANGNKFWYLYGEILVHPNEFSTMEEWFLHLNGDEEYSYQFINDIKGLIEVINNPTPKQKRLHQMRWVL